MNTLHVTTLFLVVGVTLLLMMYAGVGKHALERKRARRICPGCGRFVRDCRCRG